MTILLLGMARSGTTFLGELFRQNPAVQYLFEPFARTEVAREEFCWKTDQEPPGNASELVRQVFAGDLEPLLRNDPGTAQWLGSHGYDANGGSRPLLAIKEIKLSMQLRWVRHLAGPGLRVIHLVRDPRAIVDSFLFQPEKKPAQILQKVLSPGGKEAGSSKRLFEHWGWSRPDEAIRPADGYEDCLNAVQCGTAEENIAARWKLLVGHSLADGCGFSSEEYLRIRYEDLCFDPVGVATGVYAFLGLDLPREVKEWLLQNTREGDRANRFSTRRDSAKMVNMWKLRISADQRQRIERLCLPLMIQLMYASADLSAATTPPTLHR